jgi:hypothetical protein
VVSEIEVRLKKLIDSLQAQTNAQNAEIRKLHRLITHPSVKGLISELAVQKSGLGSLIGTANQIIVADGTGAVAKPENVTLSLPQDIHTGATPTFTGVVPLVDQEDLGTPSHRWDVYGYDVTVDNYLNWSGKPCRPKISIAAAEPNIGDNEFSFWQDSGDGTNYLLLDVGGTQTKIAIGAPTWVDYSAISTVVGWAAGVTKEIYYQVLYGILHVSYYITGTSNSVNTSFTLPYTLNTPTIWSNYNVWCKDNNIWQATPGLVTLTGGSNIATFYKDGNSTAWTNTNTKVISGEFFCKIA